ncbi:MAG TPA: POTRA domain-containing protein [Terriglobales bacterium]|nr:POTRA domain-containing protein [Terriglobales bacterium]
MKRVGRVVILLSLLLPAAAAQKQSAKLSSVAAAKLIALKVTGTARYTDKEILASSGLQIGQNAADGDFKEAVRRLGDSGLFSDVAYSYTSSGTTVKLELQLTDTDKSKLVPARFENFVWFTDDELRTAVQRRVPLFKQVVPLVGNLPDEVSEALQAMLTEKQFPGRVNYLREGDESGGPVSAIVYRAEEVSIRISGFEFPGATPEQAALLTTAARHAMGAEYGRSSLVAVAKFDLFPVFLQRGYLKATFGASEARVLPHPPPAEDAQVAVGDVQVIAIVPVTPGKVYSTSGVEWKGNSALTIAEVAPLVHLEPGQPVDAVRLLRDVENIGKFYRSRGYMTIQVKPEAQFDDEHSAVHYDLNVVEGDLYKMGELEIAGLDTQSTVRMRAAWTLREDQPYNADYPRKFLEDTRQLVPRGVPWAVSIHESLDAKDKTVDVEIRFKQQ